MDNQNSLNIEALEPRLKSGANWFYWIAALSLINSIVFLTGSQYSFILGLGFTQIIDAIANAVADELGNAGKIVAFVFDLIVAGFFVLFGLLANKKYRWSFIVGMLVYFIDGLIFIIAKDMLAVVFHGYVLFCLFMGFKACNELNTLMKTQSQTAPIEPAVQN